MLVALALTSRGVTAQVGAPAWLPPAARAPGPPGAGAAGDPSQDEDARRAAVPYFPVNLSFLYPISTNAAAPDLRTHLDLALLLGRVGFMDGAQLGLFAWTAHELRGAQVALATIATGRARGLQAAGAFAFTDAPLMGVQLSGVLGWSSAEIYGVQLAGIGNQTYGDVNGLQAAGIVNIVRQPVTEMQVFGGASAALYGVQLAGIGNYTYGDINGLQAAGMINISRRQVTGVQAAGLVNVGRVSGLQIGAINVSQEQRGLQIGIINVARKIHGMQIGVINVTDDLEGESLGIIPLPRRGGIRLVLWGSNSLYGNVGVKFSSMYAYTILGAALHSEPRAEADGREGREAAYAGGLTLGARLPFEVEGLSLSTDIGAYRLFRGGAGFSGRDELLKARVVVSYALAERLAPFLGAGAYLSLRGKDDTRVGAGPELCIGLEL